LIRLTKFNIEWKNKSKTIKKKKEKWKKKRECPRVSGPRKHRNSAEGNAAFWPSQVKKLRCLPRLACVASSNFFSRLHLLLLLLLLLLPLLLFLLFSALGFSILTLHIALFLFSFFFSTGTLFSPGLYFSHPLPISSIPRAIRYSFFSATLF